MIELRRISSGYAGRSVLRDISLSFPQGKITVLLGPNGCGKSTLLKTALGLLSPQSGEVLYDGADIRSLTPLEIARRAAYLSQTRSVPHITAGRMVLHGRFPYLSYPRRYRSEDYTAVEEALRRTDCLELKDRQLNTLSGGQRQKIYLAMALAQHTQTIFMDEPTTFLDVRHQLEVMNIARSLADEGIAVVLVLHDLCLALRSADQAVLLSGGVLQQAGPPEELYASGCLGSTFGVRLNRISTPSGWQYYCTPGKER